MSPTQAGDNPGSSAGGPYALVTGGLGGLGILSSYELAASGTKNIITCSRSARSMPGGALDDFMDYIQETCVQTHCQLDVIDSTAVLDLFARIANNEPAPAKDKGEVDVFDTMCTTVETARSIIHDKKISMVNSSRLNSWMQFKESMIQYCSNMRVWLNTTEHTRSQEVALGHYEEKLQELSEVLDLLSPLVRSGGAAEESVPLSTDFEGTLGGDMITKMNDSNKDLLVQFEVERQEDQERKRKEAAKEAPKVVEEPVRQQARQDPAPKAKEPDEELEEDEIPVARSSLVQMMNDEMFVDAKREHVSLSGFDLVGAAREAAALRAKGVVPDRDESEEELDEAAVWAEEEAARAEVEAELPPYCIAGSWDDWWPRDMRWDWEQGCFETIAEIGREAPSHSFQISPGKAQKKRWKGKSGQFTIQRESRDQKIEKVHYMIRLFLKETGGVRNVDWVRLLTDEEMVAAGRVPAPAKAAPSSAPAKVETSLRSFLQGARPEWQAKDLALVEQKLRKVNIASVSVLARLLQSGGEELNRTLKEASEKSFGKDTLRALCEQAEKVHR